MRLGEPAALDTLILSRLVAGHSLPPHLPRRLDHKFQLALLIVGASRFPDGRTVTVGRAEFDALLGERRKRARVIIRKQAPMPTRR